MNQLLLEFFIFCFVFKFNFLIYHGLLFYLIFIVYKIVKYFYNQKSLLKKIKLRKLEQKKNFEKAKNYASKIPKNIKNKIRGLQYSEIRELLILGEIRCQDVLGTFIENALEANKKINAITLFIDWAPELAKQLDGKFNAHGYEKMPLFGLPISVKESTMIKDYDQTMGFAHRIGKVSYRNSNLIQKLIDKGAIPFCLTNVPQSLLTFDCDNPIYGQTTNPFNSNRTCGGSSGGEAALIGSKASLVGFGSDLGGSIRIPAHFCECVGIKPGSTRLSDHDSLPVVPGRPLVKCVEGPIGQNVDICVKILSSLMDNQKYDPTITPIHWRDQIFHDTKKLKIGFYTDDDWFEPYHAVRRTVLEIVTYLHDHGHQMIGFKPPNIGKAFGLMIGAINVDGGSFLLDLFANDIITKQYLSLLLPFFLPYSIRLILAYTIGFFYPRLQTYLTAFAGSSSHLQQIFADIVDYQKQFSAMMKEKNIDLILCPANAGVAYKIGEAISLNPAFSYTAIYNMLDFPAGVVPVSRVTQNDIDEMVDYPVTDEWSKLFKKSMMSADTLNLPISVQVVGPPYSEEQICRLLTEIEMYEN